jgi:tRNA 5-methylaminomethyl-2-thiouridine biosynthesis bifunctional protein
MIDPGADAASAFLTASDLPQRWRGQARFVIVDADFGDGSRFLASWLAWCADPERPLRLHYVARSVCPVSATALAHAAHAGWAALRAQLCAVWPPCVDGVQRLILASGGAGGVVLDLMQGAQAGLAQADALADAFYLDSAGLDAVTAVRQLARLAASNATLALRGVTDGWRAALQHAGFVPGAAAQPADGLYCAVFARPRRVLERPVSTCVGDVDPGRGHAIVIGAGLAGAAVCERLCARGWRIDLIERHPAPAVEASGNRAGIFMPLVSRDDNLATRITRAAYLFALRHWQALGGMGVDFDSDSVRGELRAGGAGHPMPSMRPITGEQCGVLQLARDAAHAQAQRLIAARWQYPPDFAQWLECAAASTLLGSPVEEGGWWFAQGGWAHPGSLCQTLLAACGARLHCHFEREAVQLVRQGDGWQALDAQQRVIAQAPLVILAQGGGAGTLVQTRHLPLTQVRGQVSYLPAAALPALHLVLCRDAYLTRPSQGICSVGASYDADHDPGLRRSSQDENMQRLAGMLPAVTALHSDALAGRTLAGRTCFRCVAPDRLPLVGALPDYAAADGVRIERLRDVPRWPGVYGLLGYASRGLTWAGLAAELLAAQLEGEPLPLERDLAAALDPGRFLMKAQRKGGHIQC